MRMSITGSGPKMRAFTHKLDIYGRGGVMNLVLASARKEDVARGKRAPRGEDVHIFPGQSNHFPA